MLNGIMVKHGIYRVSPKYPKAPQIAALEAAGVKRAPNDMVFDYEDREANYSTMRRGEMLCAPGLACLGEDFDDVIETLEALAGRGIKVFNTESGRLADPGSAADLVVMRQRLVGEARRPSDAKIKAGARKRKGRRVKWAIGDEEVKKYWFDMRIGSNAEAAETISSLNKRAGGKKITVAMLQKKWKGGSGRPAGWKTARKRKA